MNVFTSWLDRVTRVGAQFTHSRRDERPRHSSVAAAPATKLVMAFAASPVASPADSVSKGG